MRKSIHTVLPQFLLALLLLTSCSAASDLSEVPEELQLLDTTTKQVLYIGMKKSQIDSKKLVKVDDDNLPESMKLYQYEGINMQFHNNVLIFMHIPETSQEGRFQTKGLGIGSDISEIVPAYGHEPIYNPVFNSYSYIILKDDLYYFKSLEDLKEKASLGGSSIIMVDFNSNEENKIRSFNIADEKFLAPSE